MKEKKEEGEQTKEREEEKGEEGEEDEIVSAWVGVRAPVSVSSSVPSSVPSSVCSSVCSSVPLSSEIIKRRLSLSPSPPTSTAVCRGRCLVTLCGRGRRSTSKGSY